MTEQSKADRKALIDEYRRTPKEMGVYCVRNTRNGRCLVAASRDIRARFNRHRMDLKTNSDRNEALQSDWNEWGADAFEFEILDLLEPLKDPGYDPGEDLDVLEALWVEKLSPFGDRGYNKVPKQT
ncbi:MAG: GIY-YIG nuclease family protein [Pseudomonadales bacterium]|nr:GIY-YIG nuclease family protein [Pseudomonadales bacterium]